MIHVTTTPEGELDRIAEGAAVEAAAPGLIRAIEDYRAGMDYAKRVSSAGETLGLSPSGRMMHIACIPPHVMWAIQRTDPDLLNNTERFMRWVRRHKHLQTGGLRRMAIG